MVSIDRWGAFQAGDFPRGLAVEQRRVSLTSSAMRPRYQCWAVVTILATGCPAANSVTCSEPSSISGYSVANNNLDSESFSVTVSCASGYEGVGYALPCTMSESPGERAPWPQGGLYGNSNPGSGALCEGDCDNDSECDGDLVCKQRASDDAVVDGCGSGGWYGYSYSSAHADKYLDGCTSDNCVDHGSLSAAKDACDALRAGCGGVTVQTDADGSQYETRVGTTLLTSPTGEQSYLRVGNLHEQGTTSSSWDYCCESLSHSAV